MLASANVLLQSTTLEAELLDVGLEFLVLLLEEFLEACYLALEEVDLGAQLIPMFLGLCEDACVGLLQFGNFAVLFRLQFMVTYFLELEFAAQVLNLRFQEDPELCLLIHLQLEFLFALQQQILEVVEFTIQIVELLLESQPQLIHVLSGQLSQIQLELFLVGAVLSFLVE